jgi:hypothetical protein
MFLGPNHETGVFIARTNIWCIHAEFCFELIDFNFEGFIAVE